MAQDSGMSTMDQRTMRCCICSTYTDPNSANMCVSCLGSRIDITEDLPKLVMIQQCPGCDSFLRPPKMPMKVPRGSEEVMVVCWSWDELQLREKGFQFLTDKCIWTDPHSKRFKVSQTVQKTVVRGVILEKTYVVEYVLEDQNCGRCSRSGANPDQWVGASQLSQHVSLDSGE